MHRPTRSVVKVGAVTTDWSMTVGDERGWPAMGGAGWARIGQIKRHSTHHWVAGTIRAMNPKIGVGSWDGNNHFDCAVIVMQRYMDVGFAGIVRRAQAQGQRVINDVDDWFWGLHKDNAARSSVDPKLSPDRNIEHYKLTLLASDLVIVSTPYLAERLQEFGDVPVVVVRNGVDVKQYPEHRHRPAPPVIGWAGSTAHRSGDLTILRKPYAELATARFHHTGHHDLYPSFAEQVGISPGRLTTLPMLAPHEYPYGMPFDIGVVPLVDIAFNHAKSNIKGLEYAAAGIPFVASPLPEYVELAEEHGIGRLAKTPKDWVRHLRALEDYETRAAEAKRQRSAVTAFSARTQARNVDNAIWSLL